jgi:ABC-type phosphate/phosphonate transport system substrate-binding protein
MAKAIPLVCSVRSGMPTYHGVLFVEETSPIRSPSELRGVRAAWVAPTSAAGYIVPRLALASHGFDPRTIFSSETFCDSHGSVARAVLSGMVDVGATFAVFDQADASRKLLRAGFVDVVPGRRGRIIYAAGPIPSDPIVVAPTVGAGVRARLIAALSRISSADASVRRAVTHILGADAFEAVRPRSFDLLREQIADARQLGLLEE